MGTLHVLAVGHDPGALEGVSVETADDLLGALARLSDGGVDLVLLALDLPDGEGVEAIRSVAERAPHVPVIAVEVDGDGERALEAGAVDVVPSDVEPGLVARAIRYAVALHRMRDELRRREIVDPETGLYNEWGFEAFAAHHVALADRSRQPLVLLSIGFVGLEKPDDQEEGASSVGPPGELVETAAVLRAAVRDCDVLARTGANSFRALLTGDAVGAESLVLSRMVDAIAVRNARSGHGRPLTLSIGAARYDPERPVSLEELIDEAERAEDRW